MKKLFVLSKQDLTLSRIEVLSLLDTEEYECYDDLLLIKENKKIDFENRLGYAHSIYRFLFKCEEEDLLDKLRDFNWEKIYRKSFSLRLKNSKKFTEKEIAKIIFDSIDYPKVDLQNAKTKIYIFFKKDVVFVCLHEHDTDKSYNKRKAHLRPSLHPTSMHPRLARACINLTGLSKGKLLDPFCGSGGILIEANLMGFDVTGYDIDKYQIKRAKRNLDFYKLKNYTLNVKDATKINNKFDAIVTDVPYGRGSKGKDLENLYLKFLKNSEKVTKKIIVIFPDFIDHENLISKTNWEIKNQFKSYVHKSLTRTITQLSLPYH